ncbi:hypothetical protein VTO73DRAFT_11272 [Trametes versicolor]
MDSALVANSPFVNIDPFGEDGPEYPAAVLEVEAAVSIQYDDASDHEEEEVAEHTESGDDSESQYEESESSKPLGNSGPTSSASPLPRITRSQRVQRAIHAVEALLSSGSNKESHIFISTSTVAIKKCEPQRWSQISPPRATAPSSSRNQNERPSAGPSSVTLYISASDKRWTHSNVVTRFRTGSPRAQPAPVPSSVTTEDLDTPEQSPESDEEVNEVSTKRRRSTQDEVKAVQTAARKTSVCGLEGGYCQHALTDDPTVNKQHVKVAHPSRIPPDAGTAASTTGPLKTRQKGVLSDAEVREEVEKGSLACTWAAAPGGTRCGTVCSGKTAQANLAKHVENSHWGRDFGCDKCAFTCNTLYSLDLHKEGTHDAIAAAPESEHDNKDAEDSDEDEPPLKRRRVQ